MISTSWNKRGCRLIHALAAAGMLWAACSAQTGKEGKRLNGGEDSSWVVAAAPSAPMPQTARVIGRQAGVAWYSIPGPDLRQLMSNEGRGVSLLFPSLAEYQHAVEGLTTEQIADVVRLRLAQQPTFLSDLLDQSGDELGKLGALAGHLGERQPSLASAMAQVVAASLGAQTQCYTTGRTLQWHKDDVSLAIQRRATLHGLEAELAAGQETPSASRRAADAASAAYNLTLKDLAEAAKELGEPAYAQAPPHDSGQRIVFASPENPLISSRIRRHELPADAWEDGVLVPLRPDEIARVSRLENVVVMYLSPGEYQQARTRLTPVQMEHDLKSRNRPGRPTPAELSDEVVHLRLSLISHLGALIGLGQAQGALDTVRLLTAARKRELSLLPAYLVPPEPAAGGLRQSFTDLRSRLQTLKLFCTAAQQPELAAWIDAAVPAVDHALRNLP